MNIDKLYKLIQERRLNPKSGSYTNSLVKSGIDRIAQKVGEEAVEIVIASKNDNNERVVEEAADLLYHLLVLLTEKGISLDDIYSELSNRHAKSRAQS